MQIRDLTKEAVIISEDASFREAITLMVTKKTNSLLVTDEEGTLAGIVSVTDLLNAIVPELSDPDTILEDLSTEKGFADAVKNATDKAVSDFMVVDVEPVHVDDTLLIIASTALAHQTENIPIVDDSNHPIGVISRRGIKHILAQYLGIKDTEE